MDHPHKHLRPRLLSDIPENEYGGRPEKSEQQHERVVSNSISGLRHLYSVLQSQSTNRNSDLPLPRKTLNTISSEPNQPLTPLYKQVMASPPSSASAYSSRTELPVLHTSPPSPEEVHDASPAQANRASSATDIRPTSPAATRRGRARYRSASRPRPPVQSGTMNLKQLTCHWWFQTGSCRFSSKDCLYAHHDTGKHAEAPRQVIPDQPAVAGRNADRKLREVETHLTSLRLDDARKMHSRSTSSLAEIANHPMSAPPGGAFNISRPSTPGGLMLRSPGPSMQAQGVFPIIPNSPLHLATTNAAHLEGELRFFRTLVEQAGKEKEVMVSTIESLQAENQTLKAESESTKADNKRLTEERDALRGALGLLQQQNHGSASNPMSRSSTPISTLRRTTPGSSSFADFGAIGPKRFASGS